MTYNDILARKANNTLSDYKAKRATLDELLHAIDELNADTRLTAAADSRDRYEQAYFDGRHIRYRTIIFTF